MGINHRTANFPKGHTGKQLHSICVAHHPWVGHAASYLPQGLYDLITSVYIQLPPERRSRMLATSEGALAPGGTPLFVGHDRSGPPAEWSEEDNETLTAPEEVASKLSGLRTKQSLVLEHEGRDPDAAPTHASAHDTHEHNAAPTLITPTPPAAPSSGRLGLHDDYYAWLLGAR